MSVDKLQKLLLDELSDLYSAEKQVTRVLPKLAKGTTSPELKRTLEVHLEETKGHVQRLEQIFDMLGNPARTETSAGMQGVIEEANEVLEETEEGDARDAALISAAQRVEHYEIAGYGSVRSVAELLGYKDVTKLLDQTLEEEKATEQRLVTIAEQVSADQEIAVGRVVGIPDNMLPRTAARSSPAKRINTGETARSARISALAQQVLGSSRKASAWMQNPNRALGGKIPLDLLDTDAGIEAVETVLGRIEYGLYS